MLVPFNIDMNNAGRHIYFRKTRNYHTMNRISQEIPYWISYERFRPIQAIIVTFDNIPQYGRWFNKFKYQVIIATDFNSTYAIFNYERLDMSGYDIGFSDPSCHAFQNFTGYGRNQTDLTRTSNVGIPGRHVYLLTKQHCSIAPSKFREIGIDIFKLTLN